MGSCHTVHLLISFLFAQEDIYTETTGIHWALLKSSKKVGETCSLQTQLEIFECFALMPSLNPLILFHFFTFSLCRKLAASAKGL